MLLHPVFYLISILSTEPIEHPSIDGKFSREEWAFAKSYSLKNGGTLYRQYVDHALYIAFNGTAPGWTHVYLQNKDTLTILHASAALGTGKYIRQNNQWHKRSSFQWDMRDRMLSADVQNKMDHFYQANGWLANNNTMGDKLVFEYKINMRLPDSESKMAFVYAMDEDHPLFFPQSLEDQTIHPDLLYGNLTDQFEPDLLKLDFG